MIKTRSHLDPVVAPEWAHTYRARDYPGFGYTADVVGLAMSDEADTLQALLVERGPHGPYPGRTAWPGGFMDEEEDMNARATALRELEEETGITSIRWIEELGSYDAWGRDPRQFAFQKCEDGSIRRVGARVVSKAFLTLLAPRDDQIAPRSGSDATRAFFDDVYRYLPWEDLRSQHGRRARHELSARLKRATEEGQLERVGWAWGWSVEDWNEERAEERLKLLYEAGLIEEGVRNLWGEPETTVETTSGRSMAFDHRFMLAGALGRLRGKVKYMPGVLQALCPGHFSMKHLQKTVEAILGREIYAGNFRRVMQHTQGLIEDTGFRSHQEGGGRPATHFTFPETVRHMRLDPALRIPFSPIENKAVG